MISRTSNFLRFAALCGTGSLAIIQAAAAESAEEISSAQAEVYVAAFDKQDAAGLAALFASR